MTLFCFVNQVQGWHSVPLAGWRLIIHSGPCHPEPDDLFWRCARVGRWSVQVRGAQRHPQCVAHHQPHCSW